MRLFSPSSYQCANIAKLFQWFLLVVLTFSCRLNDSFAFVIVHHTHVVRSTHVVNIAPPPPPTTTTRRYSTTHDEEEDVITTTTSDTSSSIRPDLPDFGKTRVDIENIHLVKKNKKKEWRRQDLFGSSLIEQTLQELETNDDFQATARRNLELGAETVSRQERAMRRRALHDLGIPPFTTFVQRQSKQQRQQEQRMQKEEQQQAAPGEQVVDVGSSVQSSSSSSSSSCDDVAKNHSPFERKPPTILQINIGLYCNQACGHCHVESSPLRKDEMMTAETVAQCLKLLVATPSITTLDITGGAPELNVNFRYLVRMTRELRADVEIIDRCNLTVLQEPGQEDLIDFLKEHTVRVVASLPCYSAENVDTQRGNGVFERSIAALLALNEAGYGIPGSGLSLDLVYNPLGAFLPPEQSKLEVQYKKVLHENFDVLFNSLFTITNMPIKRFADFLHRRDELKEYMDLLVRNFNADTTKSLMCLDMVSVGYDGRVYDCDFNQQLGYGVGVDTIHQQQGGDVGGLTVYDMHSLADLQKYPIRHDNHCFGCTAGMGSS